MTTHACNRESGKDDYQILRLLFHSAAFESVNGGDWEFYGSGTYPGETIITEYQCKSTGARIKAQAFDYVDGKATKHLFTFRQLCDEDDGIPKATIMQPVLVIAESNPEGSLGGTEAAVTSQPPSSAAQVHPVVGQTQPIIGQDIHILRHSP